MSLSPVERRDLLWRAVDTLQDLADDVARAGHWPERRRPTGAYVGGYVHRLFAHLIRADQHSTQSELRLLQSFNRDQSTWTEEKEWVLETTAAFPHFPTFVPEFFRAACLHDKAEGTEVAPRMLDLILHICDVILDADLGVDVREHLLRAEVHSVLVATLRGQRDPITRGG